jgi:hypothetical protein
MAELRLDLAEEKPSAEYLYMQSQMLDFLEFYKPRQDKPLELVKAQYEVKRNFEEISPEAQREILQKFEELCNQPCNFRSIVEELDNIIKR